LYVAFLFLLHYMSAHYDSMVQRLTIQEIVMIFTITAPKTIYEMLPASLHYQSSYGSLSLG
jgi:hypothetical protein